MGRTKTFKEEDVLEKAMLLFWENGYQATTATNLVTQLGISRSSLYDTFGDKEQLFVRALKKYNDRVVSDMQTTFEQATDIKEAIKEVFYMLLAENSDIDNPLGCLMANTAVELANTSEAIKDLVKENQKAIEMAFKTAISKGQETGQLSKTHTPYALSKFLFNNLTGINITNKFNENEIPKKITVDVVLTVLG